MGKHVNDDDYKKHRRDVVMAAASLGVDTEFTVPSSIKNSISRFIESINVDEGVRRSLISSLKLQDESLLDEYLQTLEDSFIVE